MKNWKRKYTAETTERTPQRIANYQRYVKGEEIREAKTMEEAEKIFKQVENKNRSVYSAMFSACVKTKNLGKAKKYYKEMVTKGISPNNVTFNLLIKCCTDAADINKAEEFVNEMAAWNLKPDEITRHLLAQAYFDTKDEKLLECLSERDREEFLAQTVETTKEWDSLCSFSALPRQKELEKTIKARFPDLTYFPGTFQSCHRSRIFSRHDSDFHYFNRYQPQYHIPAFLAIGAPCRVPPIPRQKETKTKKKETTLDPILQETADESVNFGEEEPLEDEQREVEDEEDDEDDEDDEDEEDEEDEEDDGKIVLDIDEDDLEEEVEDEEVVLGLDDDKL